MRNLSAFFLTWRPWTHQHGSSWITNLIEVKHLNSPSCYLGYIYICICIFICISHLTGYSEQPLLWFDENTLTQPQDSEWRCNPSVTGQEPGKGLQISDLQSKVLASGRMQLSSPDVSKVTSYFQFWRFLSCFDLTWRSSESKVINKTHVNSGRKEIRWSAKLPFFMGPQADHHFSVAVVFQVGTLFNSLSLLLLLLFVC